MQCVMPGRRMLAVGTISDKGGREKKSGTLFQRQLLVNLEPQESQLNQLCCRRWRMPDFETSSTPPFSKSP